MSSRVKLQSIVSLLATPFLLAVAAMAQNPTPVAPVAPPVGAPLPEPLTWTLVGMAALGVGFATKRGKRAGAEESESESTSSA